MTLKKHLQQEHKMSPLLLYLREIVYGGLDGIVTTFAVVAGFTGAAAMNSSIPMLSVLLFGFANLFADATSMGLGSFLSERAEEDAYENEKSKERHEIRTSPDYERKETMEILQAKGFSQTDALALTNIYVKNEDYWLEFMMKDELLMSNPENTNLFLSSLTTFVSFIFFGFIPLIPYILFNSVKEYTFTYSVIATFSALILLAILRWKVTKIHIVRSLFETLLIGSISSMVAYLVGTFFRV